MLNVNAVPTQLDIGIDKVYVEILPVNSPGVYDGVVITADGVALPLVVIGDTDGIDLAALAERLRTTLNVKVKYRHN